MAMARRVRPEEERAGDGAATGSGDQRQQAAAAEHGLGARPDDLVPLLGSADLGGGMGVTSRLPTWSVQRD